ncbi:MAG: KH domain-containing protein, partial [Coriobacteriales bacterium]|nr:KH domain-containing protein [Coriobacteriales bacterium]
MAENARDAVALVTQIVSSLVDEPEQVEVRSVSENDGILIEITVSPDDISKIIGRNGRVIKSIRTLTRAAAALDGA